MDKTNRALIGVEDNAEAIRALKTRVNDNADAIGKLDAKVDNSVSEIGKLQSKVNANADGIDLLGLMVDESLEAVGSVDQKANSNAAAIKELNDRKINIIVSKSQPRSVASTSIGTFGKYAFTGPAVVIFENNGTTRSFGLNEKIIGSTDSSFAYAIDNGEFTGEFLIRPRDEALRIIVIGEVTKKS